MNRIHIFPLIISAVLLSACTRQSANIIPTPAAKAVTSLTYTDKSNLFSLQYPSDFKISQSSDGSYILTSPDGNDLDLLVAANPQKSNVSKFVSNYKVCELDAKKRYASDKIVNNVSAETIVCPPGGSAVTKTYFVPHNDKMVIFQFRPWASDLSAETAKSYENIISSLKFN